MGYFTAKFRVGCSVICFNKSLLAILNELKTIEKELMRHPGGEIYTVADGEPMFAYEKH